MLSRRLLVAACLLVAALNPAAAADSVASGRALAGEPVRGVIVSTHTDGRDWASDRMAPTFREIRELGAGWVAIHPYAGIRADGGLRFRDFDPARPPAHIVRPIVEAHELGLKILIKPHLAYWGSPFRWRGEIDFDTDEKWERFWRDYESWIVKLAAATRDADAFVVGTELDRTLGHEKAWRRLIGRVREHTSAPLTYGPNWSDFERVPFWDALDAIGVQAYFPLTDAAAPDEAQIRAGWDRWVGRLRALSRRHDRPIVFTELGYNRSHSAAARPWEYHTDGVEAERLQAVCLRIALETIEREPSIVGAFLWKWFPQPHPVGRNFQLATPTMRAVIRDTWAD